MALDAGGTLESIVGLSTAVMSLSVYVAALHRSHAKASREHAEEIKALNARHEEAVSKLQEARVHEMRVVTEAALALSKGIEQLGDATDKIVGLEVNRGRYTR